jgi:hypothetical protein
MRVQNLQLVPFVITPAQRAAGRKFRVNSQSNFQLLASAALALFLVPLFLYLDIALAIALPLSLLIGLTSQHVFRLMLSPSDSDVFHPTTLVAGYFAIYFALRTFYLSSVPSVTRLGRNSYDDCLPAALWCACAAYIAFSSGIGSKIARRWVRGLPAATQQVSRTLPGSRLVFLMAVGLASLIYLFKIGMAVGNYGNLEFQRHPPPGLVILLASLADLSWVAICVYLVAPARNSRRGVAWLLFGICFGILCVRLAISGGKVALIQPLLEGAIVFHYGKRRFRLWEMVIIGVPSLMLAFGMVNFYRFVVVGQHGSPKSLAEVISRVSSASDMLSAQHNAGSQRSALEQMVERNAGIDALALIMKYTPHPFPYVYGLPWLEIPLTFVPRQIWKNKPIYMPSAEFESSYMGLPSNYNGFSSMHLIGDLYRNFSWAGVLFGMFFIGVLLRFFYLFCSPGRANPTGLFLYAALFPEIIHSLESDAGSAVINVSRSAILAIGVAVFLGARFWKLSSLRRAPRPMVLPSHSGRFANTPATDITGSPGSISEPAI